MAYFRQSLHAKVNFSDRKDILMSPKNSNLHAKTAQNWQIALFNYFCLSELFATLYKIQMQTNSYIKHVVLHALRIDLGHWTGLKGALLKLFLKKLKLYDERNKCTLKLACDCATSSRIFSYKAVKYD